MSSQQPPNVTHVGHYTRNKDLELKSDSSLQKLNDLGRSVLESKPFEIPKKPLEITDFEDDGPFEDNLESLLSFVRSNPKHLKNHDVFTSRSVLRAVVLPGVVHVRAVRHQGKIFIRTLGSTTPWDPNSDAAKNLARGTAAARILLADPVHDKGTADKSVNSFEILSTEGKLFKFLFSSELDCCYQRNDDLKYVEIKSTDKSLDHWMKKKSSETYWQCIFGNVDHLILVFLRIEEDGVTIVNGSENYTSKDLFGKNQKTMYKEVIEHSMNRLRKFAAMLEKYLPEEGDAVVLSRENKYWTSRPDSLEFLGVVKDRLGNN